MPDLSNERLESLADLHESEAVRAHDCGDPESEQFHSVTAAAIRQLLAVRKALLDGDCEWSDVIRAAGVTT